jgi:hypothetical protein
LDTLREVCESFEMFNSIPALPPFSIFFFFYRLRSTLTLDNCLLKLY